LIELLVLRFFVFFFICTLINPTPPSSSPRDLTSHDQHHNTFYIINMAPPLSQEEEFRMLYQALKIMDAKPRMQDLAVVLGLKTATAYDNPSLIERSQC
jgi:hypothetical protein